MARLRWIGLCCLLLALSYFLRVGFFTFALYVALALILSSRLMTGHSLGKVTHQRHCEVERARIGDDIEVRVEVRHTGWWPIPWLLLDDLTPAGLPRQGDSTRVTIMRPQQRLSLRYRLRAVRRGYHQLGPLLLETGDLFGLVRKFEAGERAHYVTVHPEIVPIGGYDVTGPRPVGEVRVDRRIFEDPTRLRGVRDYQPGDKLTRIHWRASARCGALQTKVYEPSTQVGALLVLDMYAPAYEDKATFERSELAVTCAASLAHYIATANQQVGFISNGRDAADRARRDEIKFEAASRWQALRLAQMREESDRLRPFEVAVGRGQMVLGRLLDATARVELSDFQSVGRMLMREYPRLPRDVSTIVITPRVDRELIEAVSAMKRSGFAMSVMVVANSAGHDATQGQLLAAGARTYNLVGKHSLAGLAAVRL